MCGFIGSPWLPPLSTGTRGGSTRQAAAGQSTALMRRLRNPAKRSGVDAAPNGGDETTSRSSQAGPRPPFRAMENSTMTLGTIILIILIILLIGAIPSWGYSRGWGYGPSGILGVIIIIIIILLLMGRL
jgi:Protein of unknown function (DUF3309)